MRCQVLAHELYRRQQSMKEHGIASGAIPWVAGIASISWAVQPGMPTIAEGQPLAATSATTMLWAQPRDLLLQVEKADWTCAESRRHKPTQATSLSDLACFGPTIHRGQLLGENYFFDSAAAFSEC